MEMPNIILASQSPRRKELLEKHHIPFTVYVTDTDETVAQSLTPQATVEEISRRKAESAAVRFSHERTLIIAADTVVALDGEIFGKPVDEADACRMLRALSGRVHSVFTSVTLVMQERGVAKYHTFVCETKVHFKHLTDTDILQYVRSGEPFDKAGGYAIQGLASAFVEKIEGDFDNVVGLPMTALLAAMKEVFGL